MRRLLRARGQGVPPMSAARLDPVPRDIAPHPAADARLTVHGKFFFRGAEKVLLRAVTYGPFAPGPDGAQVPPPEVARRDLALIAALGANAVRTFTVPPCWWLDAAAAEGLAVLVGVPWTQHVCFLDDAALARRIRAAMRAAVAGCAGHAAVIGYLVGNEIPPDVVRWSGAARVRRFVTALAAAVRETDPGALVAYASYPPTEYLDPGELDFLAFNVYLHHEPEFRRYVRRLQNLAGERPLVLTELGIDALREGRDAQAAMLAWQLRAAYELGVAGAAVYAWTDEWFTGGREISEWAFGLVDRTRAPKPAYAAVQRVFRAPLPPVPAPPPRVSVIVCAYNAAATLGACLQALAALRYPDYEVLVVDDGSTDATAAIAAAAPGVRLLAHENRGLSAARNTGIAAATGEIVAFTDADCVADPDWLTYLVHGFTAPEVAAVGGPNLSPAEESCTAACVAAAPGGPAHVLLDDETAEHIPGCNMAFRRAVLVELGGFDARFRAAGDDVDVCWRLQDRDHRIGFSPAAVVWHFRRNTVRAYLAQQRGYGAAEALLARKHPARFNAVGQSRWLGRIYGGLDVVPLPRRPVIYYGTFGRALFQTLYERPGAAIAYLPFSVEWLLAALLLLVGAALGGVPVLLAAVPLLLTVGAAVAAGWRARLEPRHDGWRARALVALLTVLGPLVRGWQRYRSRLQRAPGIAPAALPPPVPVVRYAWRQGAVESAFWSDAAHDKEHLLAALIEFLTPRMAQVSVDQGWRAADLDVHGGVWARVAVLVAVEYHGPRTRLLRVRCTPRPSVAAWVAAGALCVAAVSAGAGGRPVGIAGAALAAVGLLAIARAVVRLARRLRQVLALVAARLGLVPVAAAAARTATAP